MFRIKTLNKISPAGLSVLDQTRFSVSDDVENEDGILVRSADMHEYQFPDSLRAIARAGAGTNNIPIDRCSEAGIVVFNTPGANANAVKELALCALLLRSAASRQDSSGLPHIFLFMIHLFPPLYREAYTAMIIPCRHKVCQWKRGFRQQERAAAQSDSPFLS